MRNEAILVVDDEKNIRLTMSRALEALGVPVHTAINGEEALTELQANPYGLVFLDLKLPGMGGMSVLRQVAERWPKTRVVIITAHGAIETAVEAMKLGAVDYLQKPFNPDTLRELARSVLSREELPETEADDYATLIELAKRHITDREPEAGQETVRRAIAADPKQPEAYNLLGVLLEISGDWLEAEKFYRAALDIDPTYQPARANLDRAASWDKTGKYDLGTDE